MQNVPYLIILYLRLMHLRERGDRTSHAAYPAARRTTNLAVLFFKSSLNSTFYLIDVKKRPLLQKNLLKKFNTTQRLYLLLFLHTNLYNFSVTHHCQCQLFGERIK